MRFQSKGLKPLVWFGIATLSVSACSMDQFNTLDFDMRGNKYDTTAAVEKAMQKRPKPDARGVIDYPTYQVVVAKRGETVGSISTRLGLNPNTVAKYNGLKQDEKLSEGAIVALPSKTSGAQTVTQTTSTSSTAAQDTVDVTTLAQAAIDNAEAEQPNKTNDAAPKTTVKSDPAIEPIRHKVSRGETAYIIARMYDVTVRSLADWNSLDANFTVREGQYLLIPIPVDKKAAQIETTTVSAPGAESATPIPPSATKPLPKPEDTATTAKTAEPKPVATPSTGKMSYPAKGKIIREYVKGKTDGIDISAPVGSSVVAADAGTVAAITADAKQVPIVVIKHANGLLTVYANVGDIAVAKGASVTRGQTLGKVRNGNPSYIHFEVRKGFESVDPMAYLQ